MLRVKFGLTNHKDLPTPLLCTVQGKIGKLGEQTAIHQFLPVNYFFLESGLVIHNIIAHSLILYPPVGLDYPIHECFTSLNIIYVYLLKHLIYLNMYYYFCRSLHSWIIFYYWAVTMYTMPSQHLPVIKEKYTVY